MATTHLKGETVNTVGDLPAVGTVAPEFVLTTTGLSDVKLSELGRKRKLLSVVPSLDTGVCAASARAFNRAAAERENIAILNISADLPFAAKRFCETEGIEQVEALSVMHDRSFGVDYGLEMADGPLRGILARAVIVLDGENRVVYSQLVDEIAKEPDYEAALSALDSAQG